MNDDYRSTLNKLLSHADVRVDVRPVRVGDVPRLTVRAPLGTDSVFALLLGGVRELARLARAEPVTGLFARGLLEALPDEFDREMRALSPGPDAAGS